VRKSVSVTGKVISIALALVLPVLIVVGTLGALEGFRTSADKREDKNVGKVINGKVFEGGAVRMIESKLDQTRPEVLILGNSLSNTDIQPSLLAKRLGIGKNKVQKFSVPNSMGAHWYTILKNRVYERGHQPKLVILLSDLQSLLALEPRSEASYLNLSVQLSEDEPVLDSLLGSRLYYLERVRENRGKLRDKAFIEARNLMVDLMVHGSLGGRNDKKTEQALSRVFDTSRTDMRLFSNVIPIFNTQNARDSLPFDPAELPRPKQSFLPHIAAMVQQHGGTLVILRPPMSPLLPEGFGDIVLPQSEEAVRPLVESYGGVFLDLREVEMNHSHYQNQDHMNNEGARRFTEIISELLQDLEMGGTSRPQVDLLKSVAFVDGQLTNLVLPVTFRGPPPELPRADRTFAKGRGRMLYFPAEAFSFLADQTTIDLTPHASRCSPLRVLEDGLPLPLHNVGCEEVMKHGMGRVCHAPDKVFFTTSDDTNPYATGRDYRLTLDEERSCDAALWLYPGDRTRLGSRPGELWAMPRGANTLRIAAQDMGSGKRGGEPYVTVRVRAGNQLRAEQVLSIEELTAGQSLRLDPKIPSASQGVSVELANDSDRFLLLTTLVLENRALPGEG
jgi:hypothetical protein